MPNGDDGDEDDEGDEGEGDPSGGSGPNREPSGQPPSGGPGNLAGWSQVLKRGSGDQQTDNVC